MAEGSASTEGGFRTSVVRGLVWQLAGRGTWQVSQLLVVAILARLLTPHEYGIAGMVLVMISFEPLLAGTGLAAALIQRPTITELDKSTVFWTNGAVGLLACVIGVAVSPLVADFYGTPQVEPLFAALSVVFLVSSLSSVQANLLIREMDFRSLELRSTAATLVAAGTAILVAFEGGGAWALIVQQLAYYSTSIALLTAFSRWRPRLMYSRESLRELRSFGSHVSGTIMMNQVTQNADNVLIGRFLGAYPLGLYSLGYSVIMMAFSRITSPVIQILFPIFSRVQHERERLASLWLRSLRLMAAVTMPAMLGLVVVAPDMVDVVFGPRWHAATPIIQILSWVGLAVGLQGLSSIVMQAVGQTGVQFKYASIQCAASVASFAVGLHWGIVGVAACFAAVNVFLQPIYLHLASRAAGIGLLDCARALSGVAQATAAVVLAAVLSRELLLADGIPVVPRLASTIAAGVAVYGLVLAWRAPEVIAEVRGLLAKRGARAQPGAATA